MDIALVLIGSGVNRLRGRLSGGKLQMKLVGMLMVFLMLTGLAACASGSGDFCLIAEPIYLDVPYEIQISTQESILSHNEVGAKLCGW